MLTDNRNRTNGEVRKIFERGGGKMGSAGSVGYLFERKGVFAVPEAAIDEDSLMAVALDAGAEDVKRNSPYYEIICDPSAFNAVQDALKAKNLELAIAEVKQLAKAPKDVDTETGQKILRLMDALDDHDDVQAVYSDVNVTEAMMAG